MNNKINFDKADTNPPSTEPDRQYYYIEQCRRMVRDIGQKKGRKLRACVNTFGCQMNARDSEKLIGILREIGYEITEEENCDFVLFNTCTVRENANTRVYGRLGQLKNYKKKNPQMMIALCGCMMQEPQVVEKIKATYRYVNLIFGTHNIYKFAELIYNSFLSERLLIDIWKDTDKIVEDLPNERKFPFKTGINIMFGCDNFCTYCIVPYVRGRERSRNPKDIVREIERHVADGVKEVMLLGQNVNSYGKNLEEPVTFAGLLAEVEKIDGLKRIRFMTPHPKDLSDDLIEVMRKSEKICHHIHLPLQSGSTKLLAKMNRKYTKEQYLELVAKIKERIPDVSLTTDIIVGFPGETEEDFNDTLDVVKQAEFDSAYTFIYSKRTGTPAASMEDQIPEDIVKERFDRLLALIQDTSARLTKKQVGTVQSVLVESMNEQDETLVTGRLENNSVVHFKGDASMIGSIYDVKLLEAKGFYYMGERV